MTADALPRGARHGLTSNFARSGRVARLAIPVIAAGAVIADRRRYRRPAVAVGACVLACMEAAWVVRRSISAEGWVDRSIALAETGFGVIGEVLESLADPYFSPIDARPVDQYVQFLAASAAIASPTRTGAAASVLTLAGTSVISAAVGGRSRIPLGSSASSGLGVSFLTNSLAVRLFGELLIANADALDRARAERVEQGERLARQQERASHQRLAHDSALQLLEALAGGWEIDGEQLLDRIDVELAALGSLGTAIGAPEALAVSITDLVDRAATDGLEVIVELDDAARALVGPGAAALAAAAGEALTKVRKHSGVRVASLVVQTDGARVVAAVIDEGRGFDPQFPTGGFGLRNSIEDRLAEVGGAAGIRSAPGQGTTVEMWVPR